MSGLNGAPRLMRKTNIKTYNMKEFIDWSALGTYVLPIITGVVAWLTGRKKSRNDFLQEMQESIDKLTAKNTELVDKVIALNDEVIKLRKENSELRAEIEQLNSKLEGVKTITKTVKKDEN